MKKYFVKLNENAKKDITKFEKSGEKSALKRIEKLLEELKDHPRSGTGKPERLKHYPNQERWSRRITEKHRLIYEIQDDVVIVLVLSAYGHYEEK